MEMVLRNSYTDHFHISDVLTVADFFYHTRHTPSPDPLAREGLAVRVTPNLLTKIPPTATGKTGQRFSLTPPLTVTQTRHVTPRSVSRLTRTHAHSPPFDSRTQRGETTVYTG